MSKLFDKLRNAARTRGRHGSTAPAALLSRALRRAADERAALRAASPEGPKEAIDVASVESLEVTRIAEEAEAQERLAAAARERAEAEQLALETARLRVEAEQRANRLAKEREETERSATEALEERLRLKSEAIDARVAEHQEKRRLRRGLLYTIAAIVLVAAVIVLRNYVPGNTLLEQRAPLFKLDRELKTPPDTPGK